LRSVDEELDQIIVEAIVEVALQGPWELGMSDVAGVHGRVVGVEAGRFLLQLDDQLDDAVGFLARGKIQQPVLVAKQFPPDFIEVVHVPYCMMPVRMSALPPTIRVKLSSEAAGAITLTPVVVREMPAAELVDHIVGVTGKDVERIREILERGSLVSGASRFRWEGLSSSAGAIGEILSGFPDADPSRPFAAAQCSAAILIGSACRIEISREAGSKKGLLRRRSFWDALMEAAGGGQPGYTQYLYKLRADCYRLELSREAAETIRGAAKRLVYPGLARQIQSAAMEALELHVNRAG
jgi:hypothetical protein